MRVQHYAVVLVDGQSEPHVSVAAALKVSLKQQTLHLAAFGLLLALDLVQGELQGERGGEPSLEGNELLPGLGRGGIGEGERRIPWEWPGKTRWVREVGQKGEGSEWRGG